MKKKRRDFIRMTGLTGIGLTSGLFGSVARQTRSSNYEQYIAGMEHNQINTGELSVIGQYGPWAAGLTEKELPSYSFRKNSFTNIENWRTLARTRVMDRMSIPDIGGMPVVTKLQ